MFLLPLKLLHTVSTPLGLNLPFGNTAYLGREVHAYLVQRTFVVGERCGITFVVYLFEGFVHTAVQFQFDDIDIVLRLDKHIDTTATRGTFHFRIEAHHLEDDIHRILKIQFQLTCYLVIRIRKHRLHTFHKGIRIALLYVMNEISDKELTPVFLYRGIVRHEVSHETVLHFLVRKAQTIDFKPFIIAFDGEIAALIDNGYGVL